MKFNSNNIIRKASLSLMCCLLLACSGEKEETKKIENDWVKDEILLQLTEIRKEIKSLKADIARLDSKIGSQAANRRNANVPKEVKLSTDITKLGNENARIMIVEFTDYQCPFCARHAKTVFPLLKEKYIDTGKLAYQIRDFPLPFHSQGKPAAIAARCAGKQGKYWQMHKKLFMAKGQLGLAYYTKVADELKLNSEQFHTCMKDKKVITQVDKDLNYGNSIGVSGTPKFFVGKISGDKLTKVTVISGAQSFDAFKRAITNLQ